MKAYSQDLRERVLRAVDQGYPKAESVQLFGIRLSTLKRYWHRKDERKGMCGPKRFLVGLRRNGHRWKLACCPSYRRIPMPPWSNIVTSGNRRTVSA
jgi:hypothetical protein